MALAAAVTTVSVMHEGVHAQATEQQQERQRREKMRAVFVSRKYAATAPSTIRPNEKREPQKGFGSDWS